MLSDALRAEMECATSDFWAQHRTDPVFISMLRGHEIGHRIADYVQGETVALLASEFGATHETNDKGQIKPRSMGDIWIPEGGVMNPINVKTGEASKEGQPNIVSLGKLLTALFAGEIDAYYLLIVKMSLAQDISTQSVTVSQPDVHLVDILDYLDCITFDAGPGQAMLKEAAFNDALTTGREIEPCDLTEKVSRLMSLFEDGNRRLMENREKRLTQMRTRFAQYLAVNHVSAQARVFEESSDWEQLTL